MATDLGTAYVSVMPSMKGFGPAVQSGLSGIDTSASGDAMGKKAADGFAGGLAKSGAIVGAAAALTEKALGAVQSSLGGAISRVDTMNNFPRIMENMGISAEASSKVISQLSDELTGLPTTLDGAVASVQRFTLKNGDIQKSADMFLAVNDAILAGGTPAAQQASALEQLSQAYSKGRMDMMEWRNLQQAMPAQLKQVADSMGITVEQLGAGLRQSERDADFLRNISMDEFIDEIMKLDREGGNGLSSFKEQAKDATSGIQTSMENLHTAMVRGVANIMDSIGQENISGAVNFIGKEIGGIFKSFEGDAKAIAGFFIDNKEAIMGVVSTLADIAPMAARAWGAFKLFQGGRALFANMAGSITSFSGKVSNFGEKLFYAGVKMEQMGVKGSGAFQIIGNFMNGLSPGKFAGITAAAMGLTAVFGLVVEEIQHAIHRQETFTKATDGMKSATSNAINVLGNMDGKVRELSESTQQAATDWEAFYEAQAEHVDNINTIVDSAEKEVVSLNSAQKVIEELAGRSDLTTEEQGRLAAAIQIVNEACGTQFSVVDAANGAISDSKGAYDEAKAGAGEYKDEILKLIDAKKQEVRTNAIGKSLAEAYTAQDEALVAYTASVREYNQAVADAEAHKNDDPFGAWAAGVKDAEMNMNDAKKTYDGYTDTVSRLENELGELQTQAAGTASDFSKWASDNKFDTMISSTGHTVEEFEKRLGEVGISISDLSTLTPQELATLATSFDGSGKSILQTLADMGKGINETNRLQLMDKAATVEIKDGELIDAQGNVYKWNGTALLDKNNRVVTDTVQLIDGQNRLYIWNGTTLKNQSASVSVSGAGDIDTLISRWENWNPSVKSAVATVASPIIGMATGGFAKLHASGGFVTDGPMSLGRDSQGMWHVAGEAGREWVQYHEDGTASIVPIENRKYLKPYASIIASMIGGAGSVVNVTLNLDYKAGDDAQKMAYDVARELEALMNTEA